jgi:hypothetical protein
MRTIASSSCHFAAAIDLLLGQKVFAVLVSIGRFR